jgi:succinyl-CoA synthetase alpha subunit
MWDLDRDTPVIVQGITGHQGRFHAEQMTEFGTRVVGGVSPGKGGIKVGAIPVFDSMQEVMDVSRAEASVIFVPAAHCLDAAVEAMDCGIRSLVVVTEHLPLHDSMVLKRYARLRGCNVLGPNCPGLAMPGRIKIGIMPNTIFSQGKVAVVSRSGTLTYEVVQHLTENGIGQSVCVGVGGDPINGTSLRDVLIELADDEATRAVVLIGEIGGTAEQEAANIIGETLHKPVVAYIAGRTAPPGKRMGHAGAIISKRSGTYLEKRESLESHGVVVCDRLEEVAGKIIEVL